MDKHVTAKVPLDCGENLEQAAFPRTICPCNGVNTPRQRERDTAQYSNAAIREGQVVDRNLVIECASRDDRTLGVQLRLRAADVTAPDSF